MCDDRHNRHPGGECEGQGEDCGYLFHDRITSLQAKTFVERARAIRDRHQFLSFSSFNKPRNKPIDFVVTFVTVVACEMNILNVSEAQLSDWVVGQTPAMQRLGGLRSPPQIRGLL